MVAKGECAVVTQYSKSDANQKLSENFRVGEFVCKCGRCGQILIDGELVVWLQKLRDHFGVSVNINSGYRCQAHNAAVGGSKTSHHMRGMAADIRVKNVTPREVALYAERIGVKRIGLYEGDEGNFVHIGSENRKRFWLGHTGTEVDTFVSGKKVSLDLPVLKRGVKNGAVWGLQALLMGYGYDLGEKKLDGSFGAATEKAVLQFQHEHDLETDGSVGRATWSELLGI